MFGLKKGRNQNIVMLLAVAALIFLLFQMNSKSGYAIVEREYSAFGAAPAAGPTAGPAAASNGCGMDKGTGLASSLLPVRSPPRRTSVSLPQRTSSRDRTSLSPVPRLASPRLSVVLSATPTSRFARIPQPQGPLRMEQLHHCPRHYAAWFVRLKIKQ